MRDKIIMTASIILNMVGLKNFFISLLCLYSILLFILRQIMQAFYQTCLNLYASESEKEGLYNSLFGPLQKCGKTVVEVRSPTGVEVVGESLCSAKDQFSRKLGRKVALGRAMTKLLNSNQEV